MSRPDLTALTALASLGTRLAPWAQAFDARSLRERMLLIAAVAGVLIALALPAGLDPRWQRLQQLGTQRDTLATALQQLQAETASHQNQHRLSREQAIAELEALRRRHGGPASTATATPPDNINVGGLVSPDQMVPLLSQLLGRQSGLRVRALQSLGLTPWPEGTADSGGGAAGTGRAAPPATKSAVAADTTGAPRLYRHGVELQVEGSYADLLAYLQSLEALPQRLLWGAMTLQVEQHPRALLTLRLYTLSPRAHWVEL